MLQKIEWKIHSLRWDLQEICIIPSITAIKIYGPPSCVQLCISQVYLNLGGQIYPVRNDKRGCCIYGLLGANILINRCVKESTESLGIPGLESNVRPIFSFVHKYATTTWTRFFLRLSVCTFGRKKKKCVLNDQFSLRRRADTMNIVFGFDRRFGGKQAREMRVKSEMISTLLILLPQRVVLMQTSDSPGQRSWVEIWHYKCHALMWYRSGCSSLEGKQIPLVITSRGRQSKLISMFSLWKVFSWMNFRTQFWRSGEPQDSQTNPKTLKTVYSFPVAKTKMTKKHKEEKKKRFSSSAHFFFFFTVMVEYITQKENLYLPWRATQTQSARRWMMGWRRRHLISEVHLNSK